MNAVLAEPITSPEASRAMQLAQQALDVAASVEIDSPEMLQLAAAELQTIKRRADEIEELRLSLTRPLDESKKRIMAMFKPAQDRLEQAGGMIRNGVIRYQAAEREKQDKARREAEAAARSERERLERERQEAERIAAEAAAAGNAEAAAEAQAVADEAAALQELAEVAPVTLPTIEAPKVIGIATRQNWKVEITDFRALVIAAGKAAEQGDDTMLAYLAADSKALLGVARALKAAARIPGVRVYAEDGLAVRA